jgi:hypothetical protein
MGVSAQRRWSLRTMLVALQGLDPGGGYYYAGPAQAIPV